MLGNTGTQVSADCGSEGRGCDSRQSPAFRRLAGISKENLDGEPWYMVLDSTYATGKARAIVAEWHSCTFVYGLATSQPS